MLVQQSILQPIGVFDSGVGGLTVLKALCQAMPGEDYLYLGDTARLPYGTKTGDTVERYSIQAAEQLVTRGIGMLVVACNTASAHALPALRAHFPDMPVVGVIEPGARAAVTASRNGRIAVMSTEGTARAGVYPAAIKVLRPDAVVTSVSCSVMVTLAEEGWTSGEITEAVARRYLDGLFDNESTAPDTLVLGCTHFPLLHTAIANAAARPVTIIDSGATTAQSITADRPQRDGRGSVRFLATDGAARFAQVARHFLEADITPEMIEIVDLSFSA